MRRNILKTSEAGHKAMTEQEELTAGELMQLVQEASNRTGMGGGIPRIMAASQVGDMMFVIIGLCFDAGYAVGLRRGQAVNKRKRVAKTATA